MKTNQVLTRKMEDFEVQQRTSDGYFDANALLAQWNEISKNTRRRMDKFLQSESTSEFIKTIKKRESQRSKSTNAENKTVSEANAEISALGNFQQTIRRKSHERKSVNAYFQSIKETKGRRN